MQRGGLGRIGVGVALVLVVMLLGSARLGLAQPPDGISDALRDPTAVTQTGDAITLPRQPVADERASERQGNTRLFIVSVLVIVSVLFVLAVSVVARAIFRWAVGNHPHPPEP
jgi:hypothetical protein